MEQLRSHIWLMASSYMDIWGNICTLPHILGSLSSYMTLQLLHSEFPYIWGKTDFLFYQCSSWRSRNDSDDSRDFTNGDRGSLVTAVIEDAIPLCSYCRQRRSFRNSSMCSGCSSSRIIGSRQKQSNRPQRERQLDHSRRLQPQWVQPHTVEKLVLSIRDSIRQKGGRRTINYQSDGKLTFFRQPWCFVC